VSELLELADRIVARAEGDEGIEAFVARGTETEARAYGGELESLTSATSAGVGIRVALASEAGVRVGFAWAGSLADPAVDQALARARENAAFATPDPFAGLAEPDGVAPAAIELASDELAALSTEAKVALALELEAAASSADARIRQVDSADYGDLVSEAAIASTTGIRGTSERSSAYLSVSVLAGDGEETQTGSGLSVGRGPAELDLEACAAEAVERSVRMLGARKVPSTKLTVVFDPRVASTLLSVLGGALSGEAVAKGRSFFEGRLAEAVAVEGVDLVDDPTDVAAFTASVLDGEGLACRRTELIVGGRLASFACDSVAARRLGTAPTGSAVRGGYSGTPGAGVRALVLAPGSLGAAEVLAAVGEGLYVQSITGVHSGVSTVSGDFSVGAEGLMVRGGELAEPVREVTVASTLQRMLLSIVAIGADLTRLPGAAAGQTLAIGDFQLSGS
jgi:PmbA protein